LGAWGDAAGTVTAQPGWRSIVQGITGSQGYYRLKR